jgi:asparagine synthase (glutamine-hydrolysing)
MCGFAGIYEPDRPDEDAAHALRAMTQALEHRGPDASGLWIDPSAGIALGHRRLSILDLTAEGSQPMASASGRYVLAFNGEIYNFAELRAELVTRGAAFRGRSDTEVMLAAFEVWGLTDALARFAGMFAFALWDRRERALRLVRDRLGEKPLYYGWIGRTLLFGSELKALRAHPRFRGEISRDALALYLRHHYVPAPHSIYRRVHKLLPGTLLTLRHGWEERSTYWSAAEMAERGEANPLVADEREVIEELERALRRTVRQQMVADVPLGAFLSGGIDSSTVVAIMQAESTMPVRTFTIGFEEATHNEADHARAVARHLGTAHEELTVTSTEAQAVVPRLPQLWDEPFADPSQIPTLLVAELARRQVKVSLSGDGGDELFAGYPRYFVGSRLWSIVSAFPVAGRALVAGGVRALAPSDWHRLRGHADLWGARSRGALYRALVASAESDLLVPGAQAPSTVLSDGDGSPRRDFFHEMMYLDLVTYLPDDILVKVDRATMGVSLESRAPFLDHRIAELAWRVPLRHKVRRGRGKWLLRRLLHRFVPPTLVERPKMGFGVPVAEWLRGPLRPWASDLLNPRRLAGEAFFDPKLLARRWDEHTRGTHDWSRLLWSVLMFEAWLAHAPPTVRA